MKTRLKNYLLSIPLILLGVFLLNGCEDTGTVKPEVVSISPENGANQVSKSTAIEVRFNQPMDTGSCESRFGLHIGELTEMPMMDMMGGSTLGDVAGQYTWNDDLTVMMFHPDSGLIDSTLYSICLMEGMESEDHQGTMMMGGMMDHGSMLGDGMVTHFTTE
ncbi:MAG: Ig-like domain-containing protein [Fidelibacterota bacterium]